MGSPWRWFTSLPRFTRLGNIPTRRRLVPFGTSLCGPEPRADRLRSAQLTAPMNAVTYTSEMPHPAGRAEDGTYESSS